MPRMRWRPGLCPGPRWGSSRRSPRSPSRPGRGWRATPAPKNPTPLGASILALSAFSVQRSLLGATFLAYTHLNFWQYTLIGSIVISLRLAVVACQIMRSQAPKYFLTPTGPGRSRCVKLPTNLQSKVHHVEDCRQPGL